MWLFDGSRGRAMRSGDGACRSLLVGDGAKLTEMRR
jgi:hypothetical protein